jgi:hypothetical protein
MTTEELEIKDFKGNKKNEEEKDDIKIKSMGLTEIKNTELF